jgi:hypothetical protein
MRVNVVSMGPLDATIPELRTLLPANEKVHDSHYVEKTRDSFKPSEATEVSFAEDVTEIRFPDKEISPLPSDGEIERHGSTIPESDVEEMPSTVLDDPAASVVQSETIGIDRTSTSPFITTPIVDPMCLNTLADTEIQQSVCQNSPTNGAAVAQFVTTQTQQLNRSQTPRQRLIGHVEENQRRHNSSVGEPCKSLSAVVPHRSLRTSKPSRTRRGPRRSRFTPRTESDDSGDSDYREYSHAESLMEDSEPSARPTKRQRRGDTGIGTSHLRRERAREQAYSTSSPPRLSSPGSMIQSSASPETIRIQGQFLRKVSLSRVEYCCWVTEDQNSTAFKPASSDVLASFKKLTNEGVQSNGMSDFQAINIEGLFTRELQPCGYIWSFNFKEKYTASPENHASSQEGRLSPTPGGPVVDKRVSPRIGESSSFKKKKYTGEEDALIVNLREIEKLSWSDIAAYFPKRTEMALQVRYSTKLNKRPHQTQSKRFIRPRTGQAQVTMAGSPENNGSSRRQYNFRKSRCSPDRYVPK